MTNETEPIRGKIARIISSTQVALNVGEGDGVEIGMVFKILSLDGAEIVDPDTDEVIGSIELEKTRVKVIEVQERFAVASTYRHRRVNIGGTGFGLASGLFDPPKWVNRLETFKSEEALAEELSEEESYVKTGDVVVQVLEWDAEDVDD